MGKWFTRTTKISIPVIILSGLISIPLFSQTTNVPLRHWIYDLLERWETLGYVENIYHHTKPFTRQEIAEYLKPVFESYQDHPDRFKEFDFQYLQYSAREFAEELAAIRTPLPPPESGRIEKLKNRLKDFWPQFVYPNNRNFISLRHREFQLYADPLFQFSTGEYLSAADSVNRLNRFSNGFLFRGALGNHLGFYFMLTDNFVKRDPPFPFYEVQEESGWPYLQFNADRSAYWDENIAYFTLWYKYFLLLYGRDYNQWGVGHDGNLMLSTNAPVYDQLKLVIRYWRFKYTHITAFLQYIPPEGRRFIKAFEPTDVFWAGNRLEVYLGKGISLGFSESVVYGNRSLQPGYLNPLTFFKSLEHFYGDRDNGALGLDAAWRIWNGFKIFGEWFIDDITTTKLGSDFYGNKFGYQTGFYWVEPLPLPGSDLLVEYTRLKPYVYSHSFRDYNKYKHYDTVLGHYLGPNSDGWLVRYRFYPHRRLQVRLESRFYRHGRNTETFNAGGDPDQPFKVGDSGTARFLGGERVERVAVGGSIRYELLRNLFMTLRYHQIRNDSVKWHTVFFLRIGFNFGYRPERFFVFEPAMD